MTKLMCVKLLYEDNCMVELLYKGFVENFI